jgi:hypothetical protein
VISDSLSDLSDQLLRSATEAAGNIVGNEIRKLQSTYYVASGAIIELQENAEGSNSKLIWCSSERVGELLNDSSRGVSFPKLVSDGVQSHAIGSSYVASLEDILSSQLSSATATLASAEVAEFEPDLWEGQEGQEEGIDEVIHI